MMIRFRHWLQKHGITLVVLLIFLAFGFLSLAYLSEHVFSQPIIFTNIFSAIGTSLILGGVSVFIEQFIKAKITDQDVETVLTIRALGIEKIHERDVLRGIPSGMPDEILSKCQNEAVIIAYSADNFLERKRAWIINALDNGKRIGLLILQPEKLEQAQQTEKRNISSHIQKTLEYCNQLIIEKPNRAKYLKVRGFDGHLYFTGVLIDRHIIQQPTYDLPQGVVSIQLKANYKSQHEGIVLTFEPDSKYSNYYTDSCREIWRQGKDLLSS